MSGTDTYTRDDLRAAIAELADEAPATVRVLAHPSARRRHRLAPIVAAVAVVALVALVLALTFGTTENNSAPPAHPTRSSLHGVCGLAPMSYTTFTIDASAKVPISDATACSKARIQRWDSPDSGNVVVLYQPGAFTTSELTDKRPIHGDGITGYTGYFRGSPIGDCTNPRMRCYYRQLAWKYTSDAWGVVFAWRQTSMSTLLRIAAAVRPDRVVPLRVPLTLGPLPYRLHVTDLHVEGQEPVMGTGKAAPFVGLGLRALGAPCGRHGPGMECQSTVQFEISPGNGRRFAHNFGGHTMVNGAHFALVHGNNSMGASALGGTATCHVAVESTPGFTETQMQRLLAQTRFVANCRQPSSWPTANSALPH